MYGNWNPHVLLVRMYNNVAALENNLEIPQKFKHRVSVQL